MPARSRFVRDTWRLIKPYWTSEERWSAWLLLGAVIALTLAMVYMNVQFNYWNNDFYNALQEKDKAAFWKLMGRFTILATIYITMAVYAFYLNQMLQIRWRRWLTQRYLDEWLGERAYYRLQLVGNPADNPDQRIAEDLKIFVDQSLDLSLGLLNAVVTLASFVGILWGLSGPAEFSVGGVPVSIPGYMVWAALLYAVAGTWLTHKIGKKLIGLSFDQQRFEADFRYGLVRFRENAEGVALYGGERDELRNFRARFRSVVDNWWLIMRRTKVLNTFTIGYSQAAIIFPFVVAGNRYFAGTLQLGGLMQISSAFGHVQGSLSWFISAYTTFATWKATVDRLLGFAHSIDEAHEQARSQDGPQRDHGSSSDLVLEDMVLQLPNGTSLLSVPSLTLRQGENWLVSGPSGSGKSTLFRAIAGIWPFGRGRVRMPAQADELFLPQRPYLPIGSLRDVIVYPSRRADYADAEVREALGCVGLDYLAGALDEGHNWALRLSPGEQQRIAIARALLQKPAWLFLDEATASLDEQSEARLYTLLREKLPQTTIVSIGHRSSLRPFHSRVLTLADGEDGTRTLTAA